MVPSPKPIGIVEIDIIEACYLSGHIPITVGGGGIPVVKVSPQKNINNETYECNYNISYKRSISGDEPQAKIYKGIEGVVDKDLSSSLLAKMILERSISRGEPIEVELVILTNVDSVKLIYQMPINSFSLITDDENNIYISKILGEKNELLDEKSNNFNKYFIKSNNLLKNKMYTSYDFYLNNKYKIKINEKTLERVKNYFK